MSSDNWEGDRDLDEYKGQDWKGSVFAGKYGHDEKYRGVDDYGGSPNSNNYGGGYSGGNTPSHGKRNGAIILLVIGLVVGGALFVTDIDISSVTQEINEKVNDIDISSVTQEINEKVNDIDISSITQDINEKVWKSGIFDQESTPESTIKPAIESTIKPATEPVSKFATITKNLDKKQYGGATADITINKLQVVEKANHNIIHMNMKLTVHMEADDMQYFSPSSNWHLKNEHGKQYTEQCHNSQGDFMLLRGEQNPVSYYDICYHVEKKFDTFDFHGIPIILK